MYSETALKRHEAVQLENSEIALGSETTRHQSTSTHATMARRGTSRQMQLQEDTV